MAKIKVKIENPVSGQASFTSLDRAKRYIRRNQAIWVTEGVTLKFVRGDAAVAPPRRRIPRAKLFWPARLAITNADMVIAIHPATDLRSLLPMFGKDRTPGKVVEPGHDSDGKLRQENPVW